MVYMLTEGENDTNLRKLMEVGKQKFSFNCTRQKWGTRNQSKGDNIKTKKKYFPPNVTDLHSFLEMTLGKIFQNVER